MPWPRARAPGPRARAPGPGPGAPWGMGLPRETLMCCWPEAAGRELRGAAGEGGCGPGAAALAEILGARGP